ncbi:MAG TPA: Holliday junction resolvase RuvX [Candidatus Eisenbacteria bacterium]|nr:Holliday junction resolvase RuvX [Candidatus Eisenbacteria bacterium]
MLGVDFGLRRIGLALSDEGGALATPLRSFAIASVREAPVAVAKAARETGAGAVVVGAPLGLEGEEGRPEVRRVRRFATALRRESGLPVHLVDESLSTREAEEKMGARGMGTRDEALHAAAAAVILQRWLDRPARGGRGAIEVGE